MTTLTSPQLVAVIDYLIDEWIGVKARTDEYIRTPRAMMLSLSELEPKGVVEDDARTLLTFLYKKGCFTIQHEKRFSNFKRMAAIDETEADCMAEPTKGCILNLEDINCLKLFEVKQVAEGTKGQSIIKPIALEQIARKIGDSDTADRIIKMLRDCGVPSYLIVYPNTKWRMVNDIFRVLATSVADDDHRVLFRVLEDFCHPLRYGGDKERAQEMQDFFSDLLEYDSMYFEDNKLIDRSKEPVNVAKMALVAAAMGRINRKMARNIAARQDTPPPTAQPQTPIHAPRMYTLNELQIDLEGRVLRNVQTGDEHDLSGFNNDFLNVLISAKGALVTYDLIAQAAKTTVGTISPKSVMDRKSSFITMLQNELHISEDTCVELIQGKRGYRISRKIYE